MENILDEFDSLREILGRKRPVENVEERSSLLKKMKNLRDLENSCDVSSKDMIASAVEAMERAVEAVLEKSKSNLQNDEQTTIDNYEALPETARPYQPIAFNQKKPLGLNQALKYFEYFKWLKLLYFSYRHVDKRFQEKNLKFFKGYPPFGPPKPVPHQK